MPALGVAALVACGSDTPSSDQLVVTPDPSVTAQAATAPGFSCTPDLQPVGTVSDVALAGPCTFDYLGGVRCSKHGGVFDASLAVPLDGGGAVSLDVKVRSFTGPGAYHRGAAVALALVQRATHDDWTTATATAVVAQDERSITIRPVALPAASGTTYGVETVRGVLTCD